MCAAALRFGSLALYSQLDWRIGRFALLPGVRGEWHSRYGFVAAPRLAASLKAHADVIFRAAFGRGFRVPSAKEYGFAFDHSSLGYVVQGNPELAPESSWGVTAETAWRATPVLRLRLGGFANWVRDLIDTGFTGRDPASQVDTYSYANVGRARTWGIEGDAQFRVSSRLRSSLGYAYLDTYNVARARPLIGRPPHTLRGRARRGAQRADGARPDRAPRPDRRPRRRREEPRGSAPGGPHQSRTE